MDSGDIATEEITRACNAEGLEFRDISQVQSGVYRGTLANGTIGTHRDVYVKVLPTDRRQAVESFTRHATDVGHPPCRMVRGEEVYLVMGVASGRALSQLLPVYLLPGFWRLRSNAVSDIYETVGGYVGLLHSRTERASGPVLQEQEIKTAIDRTSLVSEFRSETKLEELIEVLGRGGELETPHAITYGDRSPHNIFYDGEAVTLIDCTCRKRSVVIDHATAIFGIRLMAGRLPITGRNIESTLEAAYWRGYESTGLERSTDTESWSIRYLALALQMLDYYNADPATLGSKLTKRFDPPIVRREIERVTETVTDQC